MYCFAATGEKEKYPQNKEKLKQQQNDVVERFPPSSPAVPCNATEHGTREIHYPIPVVEGINTSPLCFAAQNIGERQRSDSDEERGWKIACYILKV